MLLKIGLLLLGVTSFMGLQLFSEEAVSIKAYIAEEYRRNLRALFTNLLYFTIAFFVAYTITKMGVKEMEKK